MNYPSPRHLTHTLQPYATLLQMPPPDSRTSRKAAHTCNHQALFSKPVREHNETRRHPLATATANVCPHTRPAQTAIPCTHTSAQPPRASYRSPPLRPARAGYSPRPPPQSARTSPCPSQQHPLIVRHCHCHCQRKSTDVRVQRRHAAPRAQARVQQPHHHARVATTAVRRRAEHRRHGLARDIDDAACAAPADECRPCERLAAREQRARFAAAVAVAELPDGQVR
ncbi:hypothetical protein AYI70_g2563 [Smittium culicis]|uniref:Uncharacterized protein n=1 Tax=Smittium culicis TaxID=133412 RepID=A0A1R1Y7Y9_9FUNG|nr:hypothetical protein AYI70_g2563 [Smittium culicis]